MRIPPRVRPGYRPAPPCEDLMVSANRLPATSGNSLIGHIFSDSPKERTFHGYGRTVWRMLETSSTRSASDPVGAHSPGWPIRPCRPVYGAPAMSLRGGEAREVLPVALPPHFVHDVVFTHVRDHF